MTRGTAIIITKNNVYSTVEYNGDMYPDGKGDAMLQDLRKIHAKKDLLELQAKWIDNYGYTEEEKKKLYPYIHTTKWLIEELKWLTKHENMTKKDLFKAVVNYFKISNNFKKQIIDFRIDYYKYWFSDWLFIKNISNEKFVIVENDDEKLRQFDILPGKTIRLSFGQEPDDPEMLEKTLTEIEDEKI